MSAAVTANQSDSSAACWRERKNRARAVDLEKETTEKSETDRDERVKNKF